MHLCHDIMLVSTAGISAGGRPQTRTRCAWRRIGRLARTALTARSSSFQAIATTCPNRRGPPAGATSTGLPVSNSAACRQFRIRSLSCREAAPPPWRPPPAHGPPPAPRHRLRHPPSRSAPRDAATNRPTLPPPRATAPPSPPAPPGSRPRGSPSAPPARAKSSPPAASAPPAPSAARHRRFPAAACRHPAAHRRLPAGSTPQPPLRPCHCLPSQRWPAPGQSALEGKGPYSIAPLRTQAYKNYPNAPLRSGGPMGRETTFDIYWKPIGLRTVPTAIP